MRANHYRFINFSIPFIDQGAIRNVGIKERFLLKESAPEDNPSDRELDEIISSLLEGEIFPEELTGNSLEELATISSESVSSLLEVIDVTAALDTDPELSLDELAKPSLAELAGISLEELAKPSFGKSAELSLDEISSTTLEDEISLTSSFEEVPLSPSPQT
ncbi:hypothetical protein [Fibrobacter sp. UWH5]|uniref:hypothetical protein n=1 Tax=Fibrobacter sp. UWH5 TaxID=1896211 RepID=UPI001114CBA2|nr:hypothetical protein [Fibrobacter sp. UWH5]